MFDTIMSMGSKTRVSVKLGDGQFAYDAMVADEDPHLTVWKFEFFDGMLMTGDPDAPDQFAQGAGCLTASADAIAGYKRHLGL